MHDSTLHQPFYDRTAEHVAVLIPSAWEGLGPALGRALEGLDTSSGPVVDVGAGTGEGTVVLARTLRSADILAVEPHPLLRTALLTRVTADKELAARVTVVGRDVLSATLPDRISGLIAMNVIGHLTPTERQSLWDVLAQRLDVNGRAVLNLSPPTRPESVPSAPMGEVTVGRHRYSGSASAEPAGPDSVTWHMTYRVDEDGDTLTEFTASDRWYVFTSAQLAAELAERGLRLLDADPEYGLYVITRRRGED
ncbi:hypothetical protein [Streptomyces sp. NPDC014623]|uniref:hypothetical protein n=1 Tax=Streptomyces sp. NPDC014623 TaxID=3364875 RepID=UPI00370232E0